MLNISQVFVFLVVVCCAPWVQAQQEAGLTPPIERNPLLKDHSDAIDDQKCEAATLMVSQVGVGAGCPPRAWGPPASCVAACRRGAEEGGQRGGAARAVCMQAAGACRVPSCPWPHGPPPPRSTAPQLCCTRRLPDRAPLGDRAFTFFLVASNDRYGSYRAAMRSATALHAVVHGLYTFNLHHDIEIIVVDWQSEEGSGVGTGTGRGAQPLRCTEEYQRVLSRVPTLCLGRFDDRSCYRSMVRIIEVRPEVAKRYARDSVSEVHAFNIAARRMRGRNILRIDQDTLTQGPFFSWLSWQKKHGWPDAANVIWAKRDSEIRMDQVPYILDDIMFYTNHYDHVCAKEHGHNKTVPKRDPVVEGQGIWGTSCHNGPVGVYGYPKELMMDVRGMNEKMVYWGHMEQELCERARKSPKLTAVAYIEGELCGDSFSHMQHTYGRKDQRAAGNVTFENNENWGLWNETLPEYVY